jgi:hypothetical protein
MFRGSRRSDPGIPLVAAIFPGPALAGRKHWGGTASPCAAANESGGTGAGSAI